MVLAPFNFCRLSRFRISGALLVICIFPAQPPPETPSVRKSKVYYTKPRHSIHLNTFNYLQVSAINCYLKSLKHLAFRWYRTLILPLLALRSYFQAEYRGKMADPFSAAAAAFGIAEIALKVGMQLYSSISKLSKISTELRRLRRDIDQLARIIAQVRDISWAYHESHFDFDTTSLFYVVCDELNSFVEVVGSLNEIVKRSSKQHETWVASLVWRVKLVSNEGKIRDLLSRLDRHRNNLQLVLSLLLG